MSDTDNQHDRPDRRRADRRDGRRDRRFWRALASERRVAGRRLDDPRGAVESEAIAQRFPSLPAPEPTPEPVRWPALPHPAVDEPPVLEAHHATEHKASPAELARRNRLRAMLARAEERQRAGSARRAERPVFAEGVSVKVDEGPHAGHSGILLDADYIHARGLIALEGSREPVWIGFRELTSSNKLDP